MTSGTRVVDARTALNGGYVGTLSGRTWSGADQAPAARRPKAPKVAKTRSRTYTVNRNGKKVRFTHVSTYLVRDWTYSREPAPRRKYVEEHAYSATGYRTDYGTCYWAADSKPWQQHGYGFGGVTVNVSLPTVLANDVLRLNSKMRQQMLGSDFNAAASFAGLPQSLKMIADAATRIRKSLHAVKRGNFFLAGYELTGGTSREAEFRKQKRVARNWLELQYGWLPLLDDAYGAAAQIGWTLNTPVVQTIHASIRGTGSAGASSTSESNMGARVEKSICSVRMKGIIREKNIPVLSNLVDPVSLAWEALPFSFVVDWFIPVGSYLESRFSSLGASGTFVTSTYRVVSGVPVDKGGNWRYGGSPSRRTEWALDRTVSSSLSVPVPNFKPLEKVAGTQHCLNALALLVNAR